MSQQPALTQLVHRATITELRALLPLISTELALFDNAGTYSVKIEDTSMGLIRTHGLRCDLAAVSIRLKTVGSDRYVTEYGEQYHFSPDLDDDSISALEQIYQAQAASMLSVHSHYRAALGDDNGQMRIIRLRSA